MDAEELLDRLDELIEQVTKEPTRESLLETCGRAHAVVRLLRENLNNTNN